MSAKKENSGASNKGGTSEKAKKTMKEMTEEARILAERAKEKAKEMMEEFKEENKDLLEEVKEKSKKFREEAREVMEDLKEDSKDLEEDVRKGAKKAMHKAREIVDDLDESTRDFKEDVKSTAADFKEGAKEAYDDLVAKKENKRLISGIMALLFGALGIHKFLLGYNKEGFIMLALSLLSFGYLMPVMALVGWIEGIIYLTRSDEEFYRTYQLEKKPWF